MLVSPTDDMGNILNSLHNASVGGQLNFVEGVQVARLALKRRRNKNGAQRIVLFVGSPVEAEQKALVKVGKLLKKNNIAVDVVVLGDRDGNADKLRAFVDAANANDNSNLVAIPAGVVPSDVLISSPVIQGKDSGGGGSGESSTGGGGGGGSFQEFGGIDPNLDPELAMALRISMEEERARQEAAASADGAAAEASPEAAEAPAASTPKTPEAPTDDAMDEDDALLQEALAMSMKEDEGATVEPAAMEEDEDDDEMKLALAMSMQQSSEAPAPAASGEFNDPAFVNSMLAQLPGVDPNDPAIQAALASINQGGAKEDDDAPAPAPAP